MINFITISNCISFLHLCAWLQLHLLSNLAVIHEGLGLSLTTCHQLRADWLLSAVLVALRPVEKRLHAVKVLRFFNIVSSLRAKDTWILLILLGAVTSTNARYILGVGLLSVRIRKVVEIGSSLERILVYTYSTSIVTEATRVLLGGTIVIVKVFIFIFNYHLLENLVASSTLTRRSLSLIRLILDFLLDRFVLSRIELSIHHCMMHNGIS